MAKKQIGLIKLQLQAGKATPAPPVGPALGQHGVNIMEFCKQFNADTGSRGGDIIPVEIMVFEDRSFRYIMKEPPMSFLIRQALNIKKGSSVPNKDKVGELTADQVRQIAEKKMPDLNANDLDAAMEMVRGSARSMGVTVAG